MPIYPWRFSQEPSPLGRQLWAAKLWVPLICAPVAPFMPLHHSKMMLLRPHPHQPVKSQSRMALFTMVTSHLAPWLEQRRCWACLLSQTEENGMSGEVALEIPLCSSKAHIWVWNLLLLILRERSAWWQIGWPDFSQSKVGEFPGWWVLNNILFFSALVKSRLCYWSPLTIVWLT